MDFGNQHPLRIGHRRNSQSPNLEAPADECSCGCRDGHDRIFGSAVSKFKLHEGAGGGRKDRSDFATVDQPGRRDTYDHFWDNYPGSRLLVRAATIRSANSLARFAVSYRFGKFRLVSRLAVFSIGRGRAQGA